MHPAFHGVMKIGGKVQGLVDLGPLLAWGICMAIHGLFAGYAGGDVCLAWYGEINKAAVDMQQLV